MLGSWFVTNDNKEAFEVTEVLNDDIVTVFVPTTPNPTSGFLIYVPKEDCILLDMSAGDAMRLIVSGGVVLPENKNKEEQAVPLCNGFN